MAKIIHPDAEDLHEERCRTWITNRILMAGKQGIDEEQLVNELQILGCSAQEARQAIAAHVGKGKAKYK